MKSKDYNWIHIEEYENRYRSILWNCYLNSIWKGLGNKQLIKILYKKFGDCKG